MNIYDALAITLNSNKSIKQYDIADYIGISREHFNRTFKKKNLTTNQIVKIKEFLKIQNIDIPVDLPTISTFERKISYNRNRIKKNDSTELIPFFGNSFMSGNNDTFEIENTSPEYFLDIPEFKGCIAFRAYSENMRELIKPSNILFARKINEWNIHLEYGQIYGIVMTDKRRYLKYIKKATENSPEDFFSLESRNKHYDTFEVPKSKIHSIWIIEGWLNKNT